MTHFSQCLAAVKPYILNIGLILSLSCQFSGYTSQVMYRTWQLVAESQLVLLSPQLSRQQWSVSRNTIFPLQYSAR